MLLFPSFCSDLRLIWLRPKQGFLINSIQWSFREMGLFQQQRRCLSISWVVGVASESTPARPVLVFLHNRGPFEG